MLMTGYAMVYADIIRAMDDMGVWNATVQREGLAGRRTL